VGLGFTPINHFSIHPDESITVGHRLHRFLLNKYLL
jgi:hypothetical protein